MNQPTPSVPRFVIPIACVVVFFLSLWIAHQRGFSEPYVAAERFLGVLQLLLLTLPLIGTVWVAALGWGWPLRRYLLPEAANGFVIQLGAGLAALLMLAWLMAWAGCLNAVGGWGLCAGGWALVIVQATRPANRALWKAIPIPDIPWPVMLAAPALAVLLVAASIPPSLMWAVEAWGYDVMSYHLQVPREWLQAGQMQPLPHNVYGYLPSLVEAGYMLLGALRGSMYDAIYAAQFFHASMAVVPAAAVGCLTARLAGRCAGATAAAVLFAVPWTIITGSMAYDEMAVLALGGAAMLVAFDLRPRDWRGGALVGFLVGAATLAKLPAGPMVALPVIVIMALRWNELPDEHDASRERFVESKTDPRGYWKTPLTAAIIGGATLLPYFVRNTVWSGNPVFPFAAETLGRGAWSEVEVQRWKTGHALTAGFEERLTELGRQWLCNAGYGAVEAAPRRRIHAGPDYRNVASFDTEWGIPVLWIATGLGAAGGLTWPGRRRATLAMLLMLVCQIGFWLFFTHLQSRFLIPSLLPAAVLVGVGLGRLWNSPRVIVQWLAAAVAIALTASLTYTSFSIYFSQTPRVPGQGPIAPWEIADTLLPREDLANMNFDQALVGDHPINHAQPGGKTLIVADVSRLLYIRRPLIYNSAFDPNPLGKIIRQAHGQNAAITAALRAAGVTNVWINWSEVERLRATYGFDADVMPEKLRELALGWRVVYAAPAENPLVILYELP